MKPNKSRTTKDAINDLQRKYGQTVNMGVVAANIPVREIVDLIEKAPKEEANSANPVLSKNSSIAQELEKILTDFAVFAETDYLEHPTLQESRQLIIDVVVRSLPEQLPYGKNTPTEWVEQWNDGFNYCLGLIKSRIEGK